ncbi:hypothetical protein [Sphingopyxis microcysteis]|uniref:hypothetical protein n=1 Tax=Sphingopyxis microcysteis TaxID=2484145 RepID=UPI00144785B5|nr:hypothetical protein [Sphingopyxis microcysteis]
MINRSILTVGLALTAIVGSVEVERRLNHIRDLFVVEEHTLGYSVSSGAPILNQSFSLGPPGIEYNVTRNANVLFVIQDVVPVGLGDYNAKDALPTGLRRYYQASIRLSQNRPNGPIPCVTDAHLSIPAHIQSGCLSSILNIDPYLHKAFAIRKLLSLAGCRFPVEKWLQLEARRSLLMFQRLFGLEIGSPCIVGGEASGDDRKQPQEHANERHHGNVVAEDRASTGSVRRPSLLHQIIALEAMLFGCLGAAIFLGKSLSPSEPRKSLWGASGAASAIIAFWALASLIGR